MSPPTPETMSIITVASGSTRISMPTSKSPAASHVYAVESSSRSAASRAQSPKNATSAPPKATKVVSVEIQPASRAMMRVPQSVIVSAPASGASRQVQAPATI